MDEFILKKQLEARLKELHKEYVTSFEQAADEQEEVYFTGCYEAIELLAKELGFTEIIPVTP